MTAPGGPASPRHRGWLVVVVALVVSAAAASATAVALGSRADLASSRRQVDATWGGLRPALDARYSNLADAAAVTRTRLAADRAVFGEITDAVAHWRGDGRAATEVQVTAAAGLEGLVARLAATVATTPRLKAAPDVAATALSRLRQPDIAPARQAYNAAVAAYERARGGFPRSVVAAALGYDGRRTLEVPA